MPEDTAPPAIAGVFEAIPANVSVAAISTPPRRAKIAVPLSDAASIAKTPLTLLWLSVTLMRAPSTSAPLTLVMIVGAVAVIFTWPFSYAAVATLIEPTL